MPSAASAPARHLGYQPALDGIRAFAVAAVLFYHAGQSWAVGGFLGVDTFFVLSGFLITTLLVTEWTSRGGIDLLAFWVRRARRLLPALFLVMVGIVVYAGVFAAPGEVGRIRGDSLSRRSATSRTGASSSRASRTSTSSRSRRRCGTCGRWRSRSSSTWCGRSSSRFLLWWRRSLRVLLVACVVLIAASATLMAVLYVPGRDPSRVYYGTDTRAQSLLIGAVVGILLFQHGPIRSLYARHRRPHRRGRRRRLHALVVLADVGAHRRALPGRVPARRARGVGGHRVGGAARPRRARPRSLSVAPLRWVGRISYGLYLWHWPVYLTLTHTRTGLDGVALLGAPASR